MLGASMQFTPSALNCAERSHPQGSPCLPAQTPRGTAPLSATAGISSALLTHSSLPDHSCHLYALLMPCIQNQLRDICHCIQRGHSWSPIAPHTGSARDTSRRSGAASCTDRLHFCRAASRHDAAGDALCGCQGRGQWRQAELSGTSPSLNLHDMGPHRFSRKTQLTGRHDSTHSCSRGTFGKLTCAELVRVGAGWRARASKAPGCLRQCSILCVRSRPGSAMGAGQDSRHPKGCRWAGEPGHTRKCH